MTLTYPDLKAHLATGEVAPVYIIGGTQDLLRELASSEIQAAALGGEATGFNLDKLDGQVAAADQIVETCKLFPLLSARRVVVVRHGFKLISEDLSASVLVRYIDSPCEQTTLVLELEKKADTRRKTWKQAERGAVVVICESLKDRQVEAWLQEQAQRRGLSLGREELRYLVAELGSDLRRQLSELEKISLYAGGARLHLEELARVLGKGKAQSIFKFTEAVADRDPGLALRQLGRLLDEGESALPILALIDRSLGQLLTAKDLEKGRRPANAAALLGAPSWKVERVMRQARGFTEEELLDGLTAVAACDKALKTTRVPARLLLEGLVISLCGERRRRRKGGVTSGR